MSRNCVECNKHLFINNLVTKIEFFFVVVVVAAVGFAFFFFFLPKILQQPEVLRKLFKWQISFHCTFFFLV